MSARVLALRSPASVFEPVSLEARAAALDAAAQTLTAEAIVARAIGAFQGRIALVSSFGAEAAALLHIVARIDRTTPVVFLDTGKHFAQTISYREDLARSLGLTDVRDIR
ncbi:MAG TPA: hypothetical protein DEA50_11995, partial [Parvularcula sp.]|nr:hypothetical protein [Parvularcula sp.]